MITAIQGDDNENDGEEGTYFVDQAGHYYYQAKGETQPVMTMVPGLSDSGADEAEEFIINNENDEEAAEEEGDDVNFHYFSKIRIHLFFF